MTKMSKFVIKVVPDEIASFGARSSLGWVMTKFAPAYVYAY